MISYAQNAEDVVLNRLFGTQAVGSWIDVGAGHPSDDSVTKHFSDRGWSGLNIEPSPDLHRALAAARPADINIHAAATDREGTARLWLGDGEDRFNSTIEPGLARPTWSAVDVPAVTVRDIARLHAVVAPAFLKIDAEGAEAAVLAGTDLAELRPRVLVVEAIDPHTGRPTHSAWENIVVDAGYRLALFDGINRFYAAEDDSEAHAALAAPASIRDDFEPAWVQQLREQADSSTEYALSLEATRAETEKYARSLEDRLDRLSAELDALRTAIERRLA